MGEAFLPSQQKNRGLRAVVMGALLIGAGGLALTLVTGRSSQKTKAATAAATKATEPEPPKAAEAPKAAEPTKPAEPAKPAAKTVSAEDHARAAKLIQRAQGMILLGKRKPAQPLLLDAQKIDPQNEQVKTVLAQARGEAGDGMLAVQSTPKGAKVLVDGTSVGKTPLKLKKIPAGAHTVQVAQQVQEVEVVRGKKKSVVVKLAHSRGRASR